jgi:hypothetical protein
MVQSLFVDAQTQGCTIQVAYHGLSETHTIGWSSWTALFQLFHGLQFIQESISRSFYKVDVSSLEEFLRGFATFGMIVHVIEYIVHNALS